MSGQRQGLLDRILNLAGVIAKPGKRTTLDLASVDTKALTIVAPVFVLSTGRCGTKWLTELLRSDRRLHVNHSDHPELLRESRMAYEEYEDDPRLFHEILRTARDGYLLDCHRRGLFYVETNHRITFFARAARDVYPNARFIHLYRHPGDFVRSGIRRKWYSGTYYDLCRPRLQDERQWASMPLIEKLAWLWNITNQYVEDFLSSLPPEDSIRIKCEEMFSNIETDLRICEFVGAKITDSKILSMQKRQVNKQWTGRMRAYDAWGRDEKEQLRKHAGLAGHYGYQI